MPSDKADYSVRIVTDDGQADATVIVVDGISGLSPSSGDSRVKRSTPGGYADTYTELPGMGIHALGPNAVVVLSGTTWTAEAAETLRGVVRDDVLVIGVDERMTINEALSVLDEEAMREHGWVRA